MDSPELSSHFNIFTYSLYAVLWGKALTAPKTLSNDITFLWMLQGCTRLPSSFMSVTALPQAKEQA